MRDLRFEIEGQGWLSGGVARKFFVAVVVATYRRSTELGRLLDCLEKQSVLPGAIIVADNGKEEENAEKLKRRNPEIEMIYIGMPENLGCGPGLVSAMQAAREKYGEALTHYWILDDDVVLSPKVLEGLLQVMEQSRAGCVAPLLSDSQGKLWGPPEPRNRSLRKVIREVTTPVEALERMGDQPLDFCWATGACLLVSAEAVDGAGLPRSDFWMLGEDLEFSMRLSSRYGGVFTCRVEVAHLSPELKDKDQNVRWNYLKFCSLLQNLTYLVFHSDYSRHMWRYLPGNYRRFFRDCGWKGTVMRDAFCCFWAGAGLGQAAGGEWGRALRARH